MSEPSCIDLAERYGRRYRIRHEEQAAEWPPADRPWLARIACRYGHVGVQGGERLHAFTDRPVIGRRLRALPFLDHAQGDQEVRVVFHVDHLAEVLAILRPYRRRQLSAEQRAAKAALLARVRPQRGAAALSGGDFPASGTSQTDPVRGEVGAV